MSMVLCFSSLCSYLLREFIALCLFLLSPFVSLLLQVSCQLCPRRGGALKLSLPSSYGYTPENVTEAPAAAIAAAVATALKNSSSNKEMPLQFVHMTCALWAPGVEAADTETLSPILGVDLVLQGTMQQTPCSSNSSSNSRSSGSGSKDGAKQQQQQQQQQQQGAAVAVVAAAAACGDSKQLVEAAAGACDEERAAGAAEAAAARGTAAGGQEGDKRSSACCICGLSYGFCLSCCSRGCLASFHPLCAQLRGCFMEMAETPDHGFTATAFCITVSSCCCRCCCRCCCCRCCCYYRRCWCC